MPALFATCLLVYGVFWSGHQYSIDGVIIFQTAKSVLFHGSFVMNPPVRWGSDIPVSQYGMGMSALYMPILALLSATIFAHDDAIRQIPYDPTQNYTFALLRNQPYLYSSFLNPIVTALTALTLFSFCREIGFSTKRAGAAALVFALASPATVYAKWDVNQPLASLFLLLTVLLLVRARNQGTWSFCLAGAALGCAVFTRLELLPISLIAFVPFVYFLPRGADDKVSLRERLPDSILFIVPVLAFVVLNQYINFLRYGGWLSVGYGGASPGSVFTIDPAAIAVAATGNLISPGRGILIFYPLCLLSTPGLVVFLRRDRLLASCIGVFLIAFYVLYAMFKDWPGGWSWGPRYMIPLIPYLTLLAFIGMDALRTTRTRVPALLVAILILIGAVSILPGLLFDLQPFYPDPGSSPLLEMSKDLANPNLYDIFWLQNAGTTNSATLLVLFLALLLVGFAFARWADFFRRQESPPAVTERAG